MGNGLTTFERVKMVIIKVLEVDRDWITESTKIVPELCASDDAFTLADLEIGMEDEFEIEFTNHETKNIRTVKGLIGMVGRKIARKLAAKVTVTTSQ